jgi:Eukaryotic mitochondrial regulator protein
MEGQKFRNPVSNTTNYLTDYNSRGERVRAARDSASRRPARAGEGSRDAPETADSKALEESAQDDARSRRGQRPGEETKAGPQPFPLNPHFVSQSVLSESLRHEVWKRVQVDKKSVRQVSVELGVEMRRVGAVVRLYEVERRMKAEVRNLRD